MAHKIRRVEYYHVTVLDRPGEAYRLLDGLADQKVNLVAFTAVPVGPERTQLTVFPEDSGALERTARQAGVSLLGPHRALLVQGDDERGAIAAIHQQLYRANVNVYASSGVTDGRGGFGYVLYVRPEDFDRAATALGV